MSLLISAITWLIFTGGLIVLTLTPAAAAYLVGSHFSNHRLRWLPLVAVIVLPLTWVAASYWTFKRSCGEVPPPEFFSLPQAKVDGFLLVGRQISYPSLIEKGAFQFVELPSGQTKITRFSSGKKQYSDSPMPTDREVVPVSSSKSEYVVTEIAGQPVSYWWRPPIYRDIIEVREKGSHLLMARATELVFGGGDLGIYMRLLGGDQDFERVSCGYISPFVGAWRPTLGSRGRLIQYQNADLWFLMKALSPA